MGEFDLSLIIPSLGGQKGVSIKAVSDPTVIPHDRIADGREDLIGTRFRTRSAMRFFAGLFQVIASGQRGDIFCPCIQ